MSVVGDIKNWCRENPEAVTGVLSLLLVTLLITNFWHRLITEDRYTLQVTLTTVMAVLILEVVTITDPNGVMEKLNIRHKTGAQAIIVIGLVGTVFLSDLFRDVLEHILIVQLLGMLAITSRMYANVSTPDSNNRRYMRVGESTRKSEPVDLSKLLDGQRDTHAIYIFGIIAVFLPFFISEFTLFGIPVSTSAFAVALFSSLSYYLYHWWTVSC